MTDERPAVRVKPRLKWLRLLALLIPLGCLAVVSTVFGMMMAVASDLPALENEDQYQQNNGKGGQNSVLLDVQGNTIGRLASDQHRIFVQYNDISSYMRSAIVAVEDERFFTNSGVDLRAIARAFTQDVIKGGAVQGGSTITQQFVKNALQAQDKRTVFQKLRESALAYHLTRKWTKQKILTEYLNSIYFGTGAYGIEAAAQTYFGNTGDHAPTGESPGCGTIKRPCAKELLPHEAALIAAIVASPSAFDPVAHPVAAKARRDIVLQKMRDQKAITPLQYSEALAQDLPLPQNVEPPQVDSRAPYFTTWVRQQLVDRYGAQKAFEGGLTVRTTLDLKLQKFAQNAVKAWMGEDGEGPTASLVAIDNETGEVRAMVSGTQDFRERPFNLATQGQRQPGSTVKPFILAEALKQGIAPSSVWESKKRVFCVVKSKKTGKCKEQFPVNNDGNVYVGQRTLANALTFSDNSVFATVGQQVGTKKVARLVKRMGIRTSVSSNLAMTLGAFRQGVTPLDMAHAYETFASGGLRVTGSLGAPNAGPVGIRRIKFASGREVENEIETERIIPKAVAQTTSQVMSTVVSQGTAKRAQIGQFAAGKTGTTSDYGDAWFVGFSDRLTVAVWVGFPDKVESMDNLFEGGPVEGGTFPALIWHDFMAPAQDYLATQAEKARAARGDTDQEDDEDEDARTKTTPDGQPVDGPKDTTAIDGEVPTDGAPTGEEPADGTAPAPGEDTGETGTGTPDEQQQQPQENVRPVTPNPTPNPTPTPPATPVTPPADPASPAPGGDAGSTGGAGPPAG
ncbi:transglycosylase domain-containing protein [Paraconexibacter sp. AEG42_29]|uniref:transglycosylase domain-containing protein n=1 Tax=Paraconexibacter sp. AEG42_29 TaxID=2997339 RepID=UPI00339D8D86